MERDVDVDVGCASIPILSLNAGIIFVNNSSAISCINLFILVPSRHHFSALAEKKRKKKKTIFFERHVHMLIIRHFNEAHFCRLKS